MTWKWKLLIGVTAFLLFAAIGIGAWSNFTADIEQVIAEAKAAGIVTTSAELEWRDPTPEQSSKMQRLLGFTSLASFRSIEGNYAKYPRLG